jgi:glutathione reductase (NADPH)
MRHFDLFVVGTGSAATSVAYPCREAGWTVAMVDCRPFGGTCVNRGCDPKKVLVGVGDLVDHTRRLRDKGLSNAPNGVDWPELMRFKRTFTDSVPSDREKQFNKKGIDAFHGVASFTAANQIRINEETFTASHFVIAAGAEPVPLDIPGEDLLINSDAFLELEQLPKNIVFVGGGYIAFEFAHLAARAGSRVTILHRGKRPLEQFDADITDQLLKHTRQLGIEVHLESPVERITGDRNNVTLHSSEKRTFQGDLAVHAAGRVPKIRELNLGAAGIQATSKGVAVNEFLQSVSNPLVYAAGDAAASGGPPLTPVSGYEGRIVASNLLHGNRERPDYRGCASAVFSVPPMASVGLTEDAARKQQLDFDVRFEETTGWYSSRRIGEESSWYKVLTERGTGRILGAHILGDRAEDLINIFALAIRVGLTAEQLRGTLYAYPSHASNIQYML